MALTLAVYEICVDWNNDGDFADPNEDISDDVRSMSWSRGRSTDLDKTITGVCDLTVIDIAGKYIPQNAGGVLFGSLLPGRPVRVRATHNAVTYDLFYGYLDDILPRPRIGEQQADLPCMDGLDRLARNDVSTGLQLGQKSGVIIDDILDKVGWDAVRRDLDLGVDIYPLVYAEGINCRSFLDDLAMSEFAFYYVDGRGYLCWEDRAHRLIAPYTVSQWTATESHYTNIEPMSSFKTVRNRISLTSQPYAANAAVVTLWTLAENMVRLPPDSPLLRHGEAYTYWAQFDGIATGVLDPVMTTDYLANTAQNGTGADKSASLAFVTTKFAGSAKIVITNNDAADVYLTLLQIRGEKYDRPDTILIREEDATSIADFGYRDLPLALPYHLGSQNMRNMAIYQLGLKKNPWYRYLITLRGDTDEILAQILERKVSDRITLQNATYGVDDDFHIEKVSHRVDVDGIHECQWTLTLADDMLYWVWDVSAWDISSRWGY